jgi:hypothetical protein
VIDDSSVAVDLQHWFQNFELIGANIAYDAAVAMARWPHLTGAIFRAYDEGRVHDVQLI